MLTKLLFRTLPNHYTPNSAYAHFPFIVPKKMREHMKKKPGMDKEYDWFEPRSLEPIIEIKDATAVQMIVEDTTNFVAPYESLAVGLADAEGLNVYFGGNRMSSDAIKNVLFGESQIKQHAAYYYEKTRELISDKSFSSGSSLKTVDIVREVINYLPLHWITTHVVDLNMITSDNIHGKYTEQELFSYLAVVFSYIYLNIEPVNSWFLQQHSRKAARILLDDIKKHVKTTSSQKASLKNVVGGMLRGDSQNATRLDALHKLLKDRPLTFDDNDIVYTIFGVIVNSAANWSRAMAHVIDFYLSDERKTDRAAIASFSTSPGDLTQAQEDILIHYVREALRLDPPVAGVLREARNGVNVQGQVINSDQRVYLDLASALKNDAITPEAATFKLQRDRVSGLSSVPGAHSSLDEDFSEKTMAHTLRAVFSKIDLKRANGTSGHLASFTDDFHGTSQKLYLDSHATVTPWPQSLVVQYDGNPIPKL